MERNVIIKNENKVRYLAVLNTPNGAMFAITRDLGLREIKSGDSEVIPSLYTENKSTMVERAARVGGSVLEITDHVIETRTIKTIDAMPTGYGHGPTPPPSAAAHPGQMDRRSDRNG